VRLGDHVAPFAIVVAIGVLLSIGVVMAIAVTVMLAIAIEVLLHRLVGIRVWMCCAVGSHDGYII
jgi:hypothetical protein